MTRLAHKLRGWRDDDTVRVAEYSNPRAFNKNAKRLAKEGWRPTSQSQTRGFLLGINKMITVTYEKASKEDKG
jgi:hypothetical protein